MNEPEVWVVRWRTAAARDLVKIVEYIAADSRQAALRFRNSVLDCTDKLAKFPRSGAVCPYYPNARQISFENYII